MMSNPSDAWTEERLARLATMGDLSPKAIWEDLKKLPGPRLSKNAVAGKCFRLFGSKKPKPRMTEAEKVASREASHQKAIERKREKRANDKRLRVGVGAQVQAINRGPKIKPLGFKPCAADVGSLQKPLLDLGAMECRWPDDHRNADGLHTFCGHRTTDGSSYCPVHAELNRGQGTASERAAGRLMRAAA